MLYMSDRYGADVRMERAFLLEWHESDPPEDWEKVRVERIKAATGLENAYIGTPWPHQSGG